MQRDRVALASRFVLFRRRVSYILGQQKGPEEAVGLDVSLLGVLAAPINFFGPKSVDA